MVTIQFTRFANLNSTGDDNDISYGYRIYNEEKSEYNNSFIILEELNFYINKDTIKTFLQEYHPYFYEMISIDGELQFNGDTVAT
ncbi:hypothetical protein [Clostridium sp. JN-9]|uniref:hypothetical protein n=1 Tax=Clostridium sp. JN-9 TaxID=2507159 RepID=UPI000FFE0F7A|nr:hypothetical protein [Clostridium sp. JN-9]QAT39088.1 hypothetical protein EQM05_01775 [Clostridium sp. JN-9]